ncbi:hypothetical protein [Malikia spinosa]|uniref:hypothetical protein n=1 Tax=Malikia spinosa TaxID=86180 RepID=UPI0027BB1265|nr:hypothetical protein [Malikia spinosa]
MDQTSNKEQQTQDPSKTSDMSAWEEKIFPLPRGGRSPCGMGMIRLTPEQQAEDDRLEREATELMQAREMQAKLRNESPK